MVKVRVAASPSGPPRRYYRLTSTGEARLAEMTAYWRQTRRAIDVFIMGELNMSEQEKDPQPPWPIE